MRADASAQAGVALSSIVYSVRVPVIVVVVVPVVLGDGLVVELQAARATANPTMTSAPLRVFMSTCLTLKCLGALVAPQ